MTGHVAYVEIVARPRPHISVGKRQLVMIGFVVFVVVAIAFVLWMRYRSDDD